MFGNRIRELRNKEDLTQREFAKKIGIDFTYLSKIENGKMDPPSEATIMKMAEVLKVNSDELLTLAKKFPKDLNDILHKNPRTIELLRAIQSKRITDDEIDKLFDRIKHEKR
ncbi:MAG: helix-turn-helix transcriptional regulator [Candidatus Margulisiibacteriota bacterium]